MIEGKAEINLISFGLNLLIKDTSLALLISCAAAAHVHVSNFQGSACIFYSLDGFLCFPFWKCSDHFKRCSV